MRHNLRSSLLHNSCAVLLAAACGLVAGTGCESLQRKFIRKSKTPVGRPSPVTAFEDYSHSMTPLDRYRKHYTLFEYWNADALDAIGSWNMNPKQAKRASAEALQELQYVQRLLQEPLAGQLAPLITERQQINEQLQKGTYSHSELDTYRRTFDRQTRQIHREFYWRKVQDQLKPSE